VEIGSDDPAAVSRSLVEGKVVDGAEGGGSDGGAVVVGAARVASDGEEGALISLLVLIS
jgi:hypothetical protein